MGISREKIFFSIKLILAFAAYFLFARWGLQMDAVSKFATLVWPPTGIALACLILGGPRYWPAIFAAAFFVNHITGASLGVSFGIATGNTLEALFGYYLLHRLTDFHPSIDRLKDVASFIFASTMAPLISATVGVTSLLLGHVSSLEGMLVTWRAWWIGDVLGALIVTPLVLAFSQLRVPTKFDFWKIGEAIFLSIILLFVGRTVFGGAGQLPFWLFPVTVWAAMRFGQRGNIIVVFIISVMAVWGTSLGSGPFSQGSLRSNLLLIDGFMGIVALTGMILAASLTERKEAMAALRKAVQTRDEFLSIASHELKTPLTSLSLQLQMTQKRIKNANGAISEEIFPKVFDVAEQQVSRLSKLVEELLDVSRIRTGKFTFNFEKINLSEVLKEMIERFSDQLREAHCSLQSEIEENIIGFFDRGRIEQIIDNLLSNVTKYASEKPVKVTLSSVGKMVKLIVEDSGPGIPLEKQTMIFERFERLDSSANIPGLGLGLFIVKEVAKGHGGSVSLESTPSGSKFIVELPYG